MPERRAQRLRRERRLHQPPGRLFLRMQARVRRRRQDLQRRGRVCGITNTCDPNAVCADANPEVHLHLQDRLHRRRLRLRRRERMRGPGAVFVRGERPMREHFRRLRSASASPVSPATASQSCRALCDIASADRAVCAAEGLCRIDGRDAICDACRPGFRGDGATCAPVTCQAACDGAGGNDARERDLSQRRHAARARPGYSGFGGKLHRHRRMRDRQRRLRGQRGLHEPARWSPVHVCSRVTRATPRATAPTSTSAPRRRDPVIPTRPARTRSPTRDARLRLRVQGRLHRRRLGLQGRRRVRDQQRRLSGRLGLRQRARRAELQLRAAAGR